MTIIYNGAKITLTKNKTSIVVRDKYGNFVGMRELHTVLEALEEALATGELDLELCEVERAPSPVGKTRQRPLFLRLADPTKLGAPQP
jgi:hypothetical protein